MQNLTINSSEMNVTEVFCSLSDKFGSSISTAFNLEIPDCLKISESTDILPIILGILFGLICVCVAIYFTVKYNLAADDTAADADAAVTIWLNDLKIIDFSDDYIAMGIGVLE